MVTDQRDPPYDVRDNDSVLIDLLLNNYSSHF